MNIRMPGSDGAGAIGGPFRRERLTFGHGRIEAAVRTRPDTTIVTLTHEAEPVVLLKPETWDWGWGGLLFFSVLLFFRPQDHLPTLGYLHLSEVAALIGLGALSFNRLGRGQGFMKTTPEVMGIFALGLVIAFTTPFSIWPGGAFSMFFDIYLKVALIFALFINTVTSPRRIDRICWVIMIASAVLGLMAINDYLHGANLVEGSRVRGAVGGIFANPNDLALNMVAFLPLALVVALRRGPALGRLVAVVIALLMLTTIVLTKSRSGFVGLGAMLATFVAMSLSSRSLKPGLVLVGLAGMLALTPLLPASFRDRMTSIVEPDQDETGSREARKRLMEDAVRTFLERPLTGVGAGQFQNYVTPERAEKWRVTHNVILQVAADLGIFGLLLFGWLVIRGFRAPLYTRRHTREARRRWGEPSTTPAVPIVGGYGPDGLTDRERTFLQTHGSAMMASMMGWFVCAMFASVAFNWTFYYVLGLGCAAAGVVQARAAAAREVTETARAGGSR